MKDSLYNVVFDYLMMKRFLEEGKLDENFDFDLQELRLMTTAYEVTELIKLPENRLLIHILEKRVKLLEDENQGVL